MLIYKTIEKENYKKNKLLGFTIFKEYYDYKCKPEYSEKKYMNGLLTIKKQGKHIKYYLLGLKVFTKKNSSYIPLIKRISLKQNKNINTIKHKLNNIDNLLEIQNLHTKVFPQYKNKHINDNICIIGTGPSLKNYKPILNTINIGCNRAFQYDKIKLDYLFAADWYGIKPYIQQADNYNCTKFYGTFLDGPEFLQIPEYILSKATHNYYCKLLVNNPSKNLETNCLINSGTIAASALHFALYTHPKKIYLVGLDTNTLGNFDNKKQSGAPMNINLVLAGYYKLKKFAQIYYPDVEIISINPVGLKSIFNDEYPNSLPISCPFHYEFADTTDNKISTKGLSYIEENRLRWTEQETVELSFNIEKRSNLEIKFKLETWSELLECLNGLNIEIYANNNFINKIEIPNKTQDIDFEIKLLIYKEHITNNNLIIKFKLDRSASPSMFGLNPDYRQLGIKFISMDIKEVQ